jgi:hypothetical protein
MSELNELKITHIKQERNFLAGLIDLLDNCRNPADEREQTIARARRQLRRIDAMLAALEISPSIALH